MNKEKIMNLSEDELNYLISTEIFGWTLKNEVWENEDGEIMVAYSNWHPSTNMNDVMYIEDMYSNVPESFFICLCRILGCKGIFTYSQHYALIHASATDRCRAALLCCEILRTEENEEHNVYWQKCPLCSHITTPDCENNTCRKCGKAKYQNHDRYKN